VNIVSIATWEPNAPQDISKEMLTTFIQLSENDQLEQLNANLSEEFVQKNSFIMKLAGTRWAVPCETLSNTEIEHLIRFFTIAEMQLSGWEAGDKSPVIALIKLLKAREAFPEKTFIRWIKQNTDNRYLPYGPVF
jgi:hypothetical protein